MLTVLFSTHSLDTYREMGRKTRKDRETERHRGQMRDRETGRGRRAVCGPRQLREKTDPRANLTGQTWVPKLQELTEAWEDPEGLAWRGEPQGLILEWRTRA